MSEKGEPFDFPRELRADGAILESTHPYTADMLCRCADEIDRLQEAKRRALAVADERVKEANELRQQLERGSAWVTLEQHRELLQRAIAAEAARDEANAHFDELCAERDAARKQLEHMKDHTERGVAEINRLRNQLVRVRELLIGTTVSCSGLDITIACHDHDTKDALMGFLSDDDRKI